MRRDRCRRASRIAAAACTAAMAAGGLAVGAPGASHGEQSLLWLSQPGLTLLYVFVLMPLTALLGDPGGGEAGALSPALGCGLGAAVNVLLVRAVVCAARAVAADLPGCGKRRTPAR
ncbi:hypothetical protein ACIRJR_18235 [Streptomyces sp. NPDC102402]|uniref:hypothetical protein n=1 Tax=Streptomyces sp. NPDC102402 TaxID=3366169 RepID=UPI00380E92C8